MKVEPLTESYFYILLCLFSTPNHGYGIMLDAAKFSKDRVKIGSGTMYGAVSNMIKKKWIEEIRSDNPEDYRKRLYQLTPTGRQILEQEIIRIKEMANAADMIMEGGIQ